MSDPYTAAAASAARLAELTGHDTHNAAVVLGSGWRPAADALGTADAEVALADLGGFAESTVPRPRPGGPVGGGRAAARPGLPGPYPPV